MAHLATVGSHAVNGVAALHSESAESQCAQRLLRDVAGAVRQRHQRCDAATVPGVVQPRPARSCSTRRSAHGWLTDLDRLRDLEPYADDPAFRQRWREVKRANKSRLAEYVHSTTRHRAGPDLDVRRPGQADPRVQAPAPDALHIITLYHRLKKNPSLSDPAARVHLRRQGRAGLLHGQADHQADHRRRRDRQQRPRRQPIS